MAEVPHWMQEAFSLVEELRTKLDATYERAKSLTQRLHHMASIHDQIASILDDIEPKIASILSAKGDSDSANSDLLTRAQSLQTAIDDAYAKLQPAQSGGAVNVTVDPATGLPVQAGAAQ